MMSRHDVVILASGVVLTLIVTGSLKWLFALFDVVVPVSKAPEKLRSVLSVAAYRALFGTSILSLMQIACLISFSLDKNPITRLSVLYGSLMVVFAAFIVVILMWEILTVIRVRQQRKAQADDVR
jgi:hypothetical protein